MRRFLLTVAAFLLLTAQADAAWVWPVSGEVITTYRNGTDPYANGQHRGIDIAAPAGTPVVAAAAGEVRFAGTAGSSGLTIGIRTGDEYDTSYLHLSSLAVRAGAQVSAGERIGAVGTTGIRSSAAAHLHFGVRDAGTRHDYHDPLAFLPPAPPPARAPEPPPPAPVTAPAPPEAAPVTVPRRAPVGAPRRAPRPVGVPRSAPHLVPVSPPDPMPQARPLAPPRGHPTPSPQSNPVSAPRRHVPAATESAQPASEVALSPTYVPDRHEATRGLHPSAAPDGGGPDIGWALACAGLLLAAGLLGITDHARRRPPRRRGGAFSLAKWQGKTPNPAQSPRG